MSYPRKSMESLADKMEDAANELFYIHDQCKLYDLFDHNSLNVGRVEDIHDAGCDLQALAHQLRRKAETARAVTVATKQALFQ